MTWYIVLFVVILAAAYVFFNYQKIKQNTNQVETSVLESSGANYKINLLNISFGISFYIPTGANSTKRLKAYKTSNS
jgi:hypothetical protein